MTVVVRNRAIFQGGIIIRNNVVVIPEVPYVIGGNVSTSGSSPSGTAHAYMDGFVTGTPTDAKKWTASIWCRRALSSAFGAQIVLGLGSSDYIGFYGARILFLTNDSTPDTELLTASTFYDITDWVHIVVSVDTTQALDSDRVKLYVNGIEVTAFFYSFGSPTLSYPDQNEEFFNVSGNEFMIGSNDLSNNSSFNGNIAEIVFVDGQTLSPTSFAINDSTFGWTPIEYVGTYGNNGFHLKFGDANLGLDSSGNGNNFTNNGAVTTSDSPTSPYPVIDYGSAGGEWQLETGMLSSSNNDPNFPSTGWLSAFLTAGYEEGKWYWEVKFDSTVNPQMFAGLATDDGNFMYSARGYNDADSNYTSNNFRAVDNDKVYAIGRDNSLDWVYGSNGSTTGFSPSVDPNAILMFAVDADTKKIWVGENGNWLAGGNPAAGTNETFTYTGDYFIPFIQALDTPNPMGFEFAVEENKFTYTMPTGFNDLSEEHKALPEVFNQSDYYGTLAWSGDNTSPRTLTGLNFTPDLIIVKNTTSTTFPYSHPIMWDSVSGQVHSPNLADAGDTDNVVESGTVTAASGGITVTTGTVGDANNRAVNESGENYVAYCFKKAPGFLDIVTYDDNAAEPIGELTIPHSLGVAPSLIIARVLNNETTGGFAWRTYHNYMPGGASYAMPWEDDNVPYADGCWANTEPTSTYFRVGDNVSGDPIGSTNGVGNEHLAILFGQKTDLIKSGHIKGNISGSNYGAFVYTGFRPAFVYIKATVSGSVEEDEWVIWTEEQMTLNDTNKGIIEGLVTSSGSNSQLTNGVEAAFTSNGFYVRDPGKVFFEAIWLAIAADGQLKSRMHTPGLTDTSTSG